MYRQGTPQVASRPITGACTGLCISFKLNLKNKPHKKTPEQNPAYRLLGVEQWVGAL